MPLFGRETEAQVILDALPDYHDGTFGYVVYRTVYGNDEEWGRFMDRLSQYANAALDRAPDGVNIKDSFQWDVRENREELEGASIAEVRKKFRECASSVNGKLTRPLYTKCILVDASVIESVLAGEDPSSTAPNDILRPTAYVKVIDARYKDQIEPVDEDEIPDETARRRHNEGDEGFPQIEGCRRRDVGWMKVPARRLVPVAYQKLMGNGWHVYYVRPPGMFDY